MFVFERFNSWICKRVTNMRYPEATAIETFLLHDWCHYMLSSGRAPKSMDSLVPLLESSMENENEETLDSLHQKKKTCHLGRRLRNYFVSHVQHTNISIIRKQMQILTVFKYILVRAGS